MRNLFIISICSLILTACGTMPYVSTEYPLRAGLIQPVKVVGKADVTNAQTSDERVIVYSYMGTKLDSSIKSITETMVQQTQKELLKNGQPVDGNGSKSIAIKVNSLRSTYTNLLFWRSKIKFEVTLGNGQTIPFTVPHTSGVLVQDLNGCIAEGVMTLLNDARVRSYLAEK